MKFFSKNKKNLTPQQMNIDELKLVPISDDEAALINGGMEIILGAKTKAKIDSPEPWEVC
ncbi:hypothetical protein H6G36_27145 [Anabaena minutissima FACHB-250]|nr:hypothetical protein [Anabaena minutissima FACHB-250]